MYTRLVKYFVEVDGELISETEATLDQKKNYPWHCWIYTDCGGLAKGCGNTKIDAALSAKRLD